MSFYCIKDYYCDVVHIRAGQIVRIFDYSDPWDKKRTVSMWLKTPTGLQHFEVNKKEFMEYFVFIGF